MENKDVNVPLVQLGELKPEQSAQPAQLPGLGISSLLDNEPPTKKIKVEESLNTKDSNKIPEAEPKQPTPVHEPAVAESENPNELSVQEEKPDKTPEVDTTLDGPGSKDKPEDKPEDKLQDAPQEESQAKLDDKADVTEDAVEPAEKKTPVRPPITLDKTPIVEILNEYFPRRRVLGTIIYNPTLTWDSVQLDLLVGLKQEHLARFSEIRQAYLARLQEPEAQEKYLPVVPPFSNDYINYLLEVKIPYRYVKLFHENPYVQHKVWGGAGGIYTDDSDVLAVLAHLGLFENKIDLLEWNNHWKGPVVQPPDLKTDLDNNLLADISVTLLLLPSLPEYHGFYSHGVNSYHWNKHSGLSYAVYNVKYEAMGTYTKDSAFLKRATEETTSDAAYLDSSHHSWKFKYSLYKQIRARANGTA